MSAEDRTIYLVTLDDETRRKVEWVLASLDATHLPAAVAADV